MLTLCEWPKLIGITLEGCGIDDMELQQFLQLPAPKL